MQSIKFLEPPALSSENDSDNTYVQASISVVSHPDESPFGGDVSIEASLLSEDDNESACLVEAYEWKAGATSLSISFDITNINVIWPARIKVSSKDQDVTRLTDIVEHSTQDESRRSQINAVWSEVLRPDRSFKAEARTARHFVLSTERTLKIWESFDRLPASQLRPIGVAMLAYLDSVLANKMDTISELDEKLALAASKTLHVVDFCNNCGIVGIGLAQLIPDCRVVILDAPDERAIAQMNIEETFPAVLSTVKYENVNSVKAESLAKTTKPTDLILLEDSLYDESSAQSVIRILTDLLENSPRVVVLLAHDLQDKKDSVFRGALDQAGASHSGAVHVPSLRLNDTDEENELAVFNIDIFCGKAPLSRAAKRQNDISV